MYRPFGFNLGGFVDVWCPSSHRIYHASLDNGTLEQFATNSSSLESLKVVLHTLSLFDTQNISGALRSGIRSWGIQDTV